MATTTRRPRRQPMRDATAPAAAPLAILDGGVARIAYRLSWLANFYSGPIYRRFEMERGLTRPEFVVLHCAVQCPGVTARDIGLMTGLPKNSISRAVQRLLREGRIARGTDAADARALPLAVTAKGRALYDELIKPFAAREDQMLAPLSRAERAEFDRLLGKLTARTDDWAKIY